jgi:hypothetical protein
MPALLALDPAHPHILPLLDSSEADGVRYYVSRW